MKFNHTHTNKHPFGCYFIVNTCCIENEQIKKRKTINTRIEFDDKTNSMKDRERRFVYIRCMFPNIEDYCRLWLMNNQDLYNSNPKVSNWLYEFSMVESKIQLRWWILLLFFRFLTVTLAKLGPPPEFNCWTSWSADTFFDSAIWSTSCLKPFNSKVFLF